MTHEIHSLDRGGSIGRGCRLRLQAAGTVGGGKGCCRGSSAAQAASPAPDGPVVDEAVVRATEARAQAAEDRAAAAEAEAKKLRTEAMAQAAESRAAEARAARSEAQRAAEEARAHAATHEDDRAVATATESRAATPMPTPQPLVIPDGTHVSLTVETPLSTETGKLEDRVDASLNNDIMVDGRVAVPAGTSFRGYISQIQRSKKIGGRAALGVQFTSFRLGGRQYAIDATSIGIQGKGGKKDAAVIGGGTAGGAILGGLLKGGKGAIIGGILGGATGTVVAAKDRDDVVVPSGTVWSIELTAPVTIH